MSNRSSDTTLNRRVDSEESYPTNDEIEIHESTSAIIDAISEASPTNEPSTDSAISPSSHTNDGTLVTINNQQYYFPELSAREKALKTRKMGKMLKPVLFEQKLDKPGISDHVSIVRLDSGVTKLVCKNCNTVFSTIELLTEHVEDALPTVTQESHQCPDCPSTWKTKGILLSHRRDFHDFKTYKCLSFDE